MSRPGNGWSLVALLLLLPLAPACSSVTITAASSINPVMVGPVKTFDGGLDTLPPDYRERYDQHFSPSRKGKATTPEARERFEKAADFFFVTYTVEVGSTGSVSSAGGNSYDVNSSSFSAVDKPHKTDVQVIRVTKGDMNRRIDVGSIECGGYTFYMLLGFMEKIDCRTVGFSPIPR